MDKRSGEDMAKEAFRLSAWISEVLEEAEEADIPDDIIDDIKFYLARLGYLADNGEIPMDAAGLAQALRKFQRFYALQIQDGSLGLETLKALIAPRCAVPDGIKYWTPAGFKSNEPCPWEKTPTFELKYSFLPGTPGKFINVVRAAMRGWEKILMDRRALTLVKFVETSSGPVDVIIGWTQTVIGGEHDLTGSYIAHANFPCHNGSVKFMHFDNHEHAWAPGVKPNRLNAEAVALHELGHILGLTHSSNPNVAMYPTFQKNSDIRPIGSEGRKALRKLYGFPP